MELIYLRASELEPVGSAKGGECLEVDVDPENIRWYGDKSGKHFIIRQIDLNRWRIWRR